MYKETIEISKVKAKIGEVVKAIAGVSNDHTLLQDIPFIGDEPQKRGVPMKVQQSRGLGILASARQAQNPTETDTKIILLVLGGLTHFEITDLATFERQMVSSGIWTRERLVVGSVPLNGSGCILRADKFIKLLSKV